MQSVIIVKKSRVRLIFCDSAPAGGISREFLEPSEQAVSFFLRESRPGGQREWQRCSLVLLYSYDENPAAELYVWPVSGLGLRAACRVHRGSVTQALPCGRANPAASLYEIVLDALSDEIHLPEIILGRRVPLKRGLLPPLHRMPVASRDIQAVKEEIAHLKLRHRTARYGCLVYLVYVRTGIPLCGDKHITVDLLS